MSLNIQNPEAEQLAAEIADKLGISTSDAVVLALKEKREHLNQKQTKTELLHAFVKEINAASPDVRSKLDADDLYDDQGLPH